MAVKFSEFTPKSDATSSSVTEIVGYLSSTQLNVRIPPSALDTTYTFGTTNGSSPVLTLAGTKTGETIADTVVTLTSTGGTTLTGSSSNAIAIDSVTYALEAGAKATGKVPINLNASGSFTDSVVNLKEGSNITLTQNSATEIEISATGGGGGGGVSSVGLDVSAFAAFSVTGSPVTSSGNITLGISGGSSGQYLDYQGNWSTPAGGGGGGGVTSFTNSNGTFISAGTVNSSATGAVTMGTIDLSATGSASASTFLRGDNSWATPTDTNTTYTVDVPAATTNINLAGSDASNDAITLTGGTDIGITRTSDSELTIDYTGSAAGTTKLVVTKTGNNSDTVFTDITTGLTLPVSNSNYYVDVYISGVYQAKSTYAYTTANNGTITFDSGSVPPVTATNGIEFVTTV